MSYILKDNTATVGDAIREILNECMIEGLYKIPTNASPRTTERLHLAHVAMTNFALQLESAFTSRVGVRVDEIRLPK